MNLRDRVMDQARKRFFSDILFHRRDRIERACGIFRRWNRHETTPPWNTLTYLQAVDRMQRRVL